jgi:formate hydrogenlyase subunit 4
MKWIAAIAFVLFAPLIAGVLAGIDRKLSARLQRRIGPPVMQPFYDLGKLFQKESITSRGLSASQFFLAGYLLFIIWAGAIFFSGGDLLIAIFALALSSVFLVLGAFAASSPYSHVGAERELLLMMAAEPMLLVVALGFYASTRSFSVGIIAQQHTPLIVTLPAIFFGLLYILTIKLRKSPFDISTSHHAHQEIVKGLTTEFSGASLAIIELGHWYETVILLGFVYLFFASWPVVGLIVTFVAFLGETLIDNTNARIKWQGTLRSAWIVTLICGVINLAGLQIWFGLGG